MQKIHYMHKNVIIKENETKTYYINIPFKLPLVSIYTLQASTSGMHKETLKLS